MSGREWKPGDARSAVVNGERMLVLRGRGIFKDNWYTPGPVAGSRTNVAESWLEDARPLVVIDAEDREQVERLTKLFCEGSFRHLPNVTAMTAALREFANPTPPEVLEHFITNVSPDGISTAHCGKVWRRSDNVTVAGRCTSCEELVKTGWQA